MENYGYKKWGIAFGIFGFIHGIVSFMWSIGTMMIALSFNTFSFILDSANFNGMTSMTTTLIIFVGIVALLGLLYSILGVVGWSKKKLSITGIVFNALSISILAIIAFFVFVIQVI